MRTARPYVLHSLGAGVVLLAACNESVTAPGVCPEFCPSSEVVVLDTILRASVERDSSFVGYVLSHEAGGMQVATGGVVESRGLIRFLPFGTNSAFGTGVNQTGPVAQIDSFRVKLVLAGRHEATPTLTVDIYRVPATIDTATTFVDTDAYFIDSLRIGSTVVGDLFADTSATDSIFADSAFVWLPGDAFADRDDTVAVAIGVAVRGEVPTWLSLNATSILSTSALISRHTQVDSGGAGTVLLVGTDLRGPAFDTFVKSEPPPVQSGSLIVGGTPSARTFLRLILPESIIDSAAIVGGAVLLVPTDPAIGAPRDTFGIQAVGLGADFGPKSPVAATTGQTGRVPVGSMDTVAVDITAILQAWQSDSGIPHTVMLRVFPEGASLGELHFGSSTNPAARPVLRLTYVSPFRFEGQR